MDYLTTYEAELSLNSQLRFYRQSIRNFRSAAEALSFIQCERRRFAEQVAETMTADFIESYLKEKECLTESSSFSVAL